MAKPTPKLPGFGQLLRTQRQWAALTLDELGRSCGVDPADISRWESSTRKPPERPIVVRISKAFGFNPDTAETRLFLAAAERERYEDFDEEYLLDVRRYQHPKAPSERTGNRVGPKVALGSTEWLNRHQGRHHNPIFTAVDDAEMVEQLMRVIRKSGWQRVSVLQQDGTMQDIVRKEKKSSPEGLQQKT